MITRILFLSFLATSATALDLEPPDLEGRVERVVGDARRIIIAISTPGFGCEQAWIKVPAEASVGFGQGEKVREASFADLAADSIVAVWFDEAPIKRFDPLHASAERVMIRDAVAPAPVDRHSMESVLADAIRQGWLDEDGAERIRDTARFHDGLMNLGSFAPLADDARWLGIPGVMREMMVPSGASLAEIADACRRIRDSDQRSYIRMVATGDDSLLYLPLRPVDETPEAGKGAWIQAQISDGGGATTSATVLVSTGTEVSMISPATLARLEPQITGVVVTPLLGETRPSYLLIVEGLEITVGVDTSAGRRPVSSTEIFLLGNSDILGNSHLADLDVTVSFSGEGGSLRLRR